MPVRVAVAMFPTMAMAGGCGPEQKIGATRPPKPVCRVTVRNLRSSKPVLIRIPLASNRSRIRGCRFFQTAVSGRRQVDSSVLPATMYTSGIQQDRKGMWRTWKGGPKTVSCEYPTSHRLSAQLVIKRKKTYTERTTICALRRRPRATSSGCRPLSPDRAEHAISRIMLPGPNYGPVNHSPATPLLPCAYPVMVG